MNRKAKLKNSVALAAVEFCLALTISYLPTVAAAQTSPPSASSGPQNSIQEVTVTARQTKERLQEVPLVISAFSDKNLKAANVQTLEDIALLTPGVTTYGMGSEYETAVVIRGMAQEAFTGLGDNNVSIFFDGAYIFNSSAIDMALLGLDRIEVVKGPVSALYGRDAYAGAINYVTSTPTNTVHADIAATGGDHGRAGVQADLSGPLVQDVLKARVAINYDRFDGTYHDSTSGQSAGGYEKKDIELKLNFTPNSKLTMNGLFYYGDDHFGPSAESFVPNNCAFGPLGITGQEGFNAYCGKIGYSAPQIPNSPGAGVAGNNRTVLHAQINTDLDLGWSTLTSITSFNDDKSARFQTLEARDDGFAYALTPGPGSVNLITNEGYNMNNKDISEELRLSSRQDQPLRWKFGGFYYNSKITNTVLYGIGPGSSIPTGQAPDIFFLFSPLVTSNGQPSGTPTLANTRDIQTSEFVALDYDILHNLTISGEIRRSQIKEYEDTVSNLVLPGVFEPAGPPQTQHNSPTNARVTLNYKMTSHVLLYASAANGTKSGGFNVTATFAEDRPYGEQKNNTYEVGAKTSFFGNRLQLNGDVFHYDERGLQLNAPSSDPTNPSDVIKNFGGDRSTGFELDAQATPLRGLTLTSGLSYTDPKFTSKTYDYGDAAICAQVASCAPRLTTVNGVAAVKVGGLSTPYESNWTFNLGADYTHPLGLAEGWNWFAHGDYRFSSKQYGSVAHFYDYGPFNNVNISAGVTNGAYTVRLWAKNLADDRTPDFAFTYTNIPLWSQPYAYLPDGRTFGATVEYKY